MTGGAAAGAIPDLVREHIDGFACPACGGRLDVSTPGEGIRCGTCRRAFACEGRIPLLFWPDESGPGDVTGIVRAFYEAHPFPNYDDVDSPAALREKATRAVFPRLLDEQLSHRVRILEVGCGTGQLSNFLAMTRGRRVFATDMCLSALRLGRAFQEQHGIDAVCFLQMNLFRPVFRPALFDAVLCNGVLHHTSDPFRGFASIARLVRPGGFIIVGLYNRYGRLPTDLRRLVFRLTGKAFRWLDPRWRDEDLGDVKRETWFADQYENPHESKHTIGEVLEWLERVGFDYVNGIPKASGAPLAPDEKLFERNPPGSRLDRLLAQVGMLADASREGGLFVVIGSRRA